MSAANGDNLRRLVLLAFAEWSPCVYMGAIPCDECSRKNCGDGDMCDMYHGRTGHQKAFEAGWNHKQNASHHAEATADSVHGIVGNSREAKR